MKYYYHSAMGNGIYEYDGKQYYYHYSGTCELLIDGKFSGQVSDELRHKIVTEGEHIKVC